MEKKQRETDHQVSQASLWSYVCVYVMWVTVSVLPYRHSRTLMLSLRRLGLAKSCHWSWNICTGHQAKDMVAIVNKFASKIEEKKGTVSEDEVRLVCTHCFCARYSWNQFQTVAFKSYLLSAGIANPVTKWVNVCMWGCVGCVSKNLLSYACIFHIIGRPMVLVQPITKNWPNNWQCFWTSLCRLASFKQQFIATYTQTIIN